MKIKSIAIALSMVMSSQVFAGEDKFLDISNEVKQAQQLFSGNYEEGVVFDKKLAISMGFSQKTIKISVEMEKLTNILISRTKDKLKQKVNQKRLDNSILKHDYSETFSSISLFDYPELTWFMGSLKEQKSVSHDFESVNQQDYSTLGLFDATEICGSIWNHKPTKAAPWVSQSISSLDQARTILYVSGYHKTDEDYGGGWTRPQSYQSWICGEGSFRDHATINSSHTTLNIQDYSGFSPRGEPNPEINTYTWPYAAWPTYVFYWHTQY